MRASAARAAVTEILENLTGQRMLFQPLSYLIRTGEPDGQDLLGAMNFATMAVNLLAEGKTGRLVAYRQRENYVDAPHRRGDPGASATLTSPTITTPRPIAPSPAFCGRQGESPQWRRFQRIDVPTWSRQWISNG